MPKDYSEKKIHVFSERLDNVVKSALSMQRARAEEAFLAGKLMVNGEKAYKKAQELFRGDTVDLIIGPSPDNVDFTVVKRFTIVHKENTTKGKIALTIRKWDSMVVDDYSSGNKEKEED